MKKNIEKTKENKCDCGSCSCDENTVQIKELENNWKRALADYKNLEKRVAEEREMVVLFANSVLMLRMLPILDNLEMIEKHIDDDGVKMTVKEFKKVLEDEGVLEIKALGEKFDPEMMDAVEKVGEEGNIVVEVVTNGYMLKSKVLRPARVKVGQGKEK